MVHSTLLALILVVVEEEQISWTPQYLLQRLRMENKGEEKLLETYSFEGEEPVSCNQMQMIPNVAVALDWKSTRTKMLGAPDLSDLDQTDPEHATPGPSSLKKGSS